MKLVDTHCHLDNEKFDEDRLEIIERIKENLEFCVNIGYDLASSKKSLELAKKYDFIYAVIGVHPIDIAEYDEEVEKELELLGKNPKVVAIGEIGLDYHWMTEPKEVQQERFKKQLELAERLNKPVVIHTRDAMEDTVNILKEYPNITGVIHCYPGSLETAKQLVDRFYLGIGGTLTFKNSKKAVEVVKDIPLDRIVIETDCPYLTPEPFRGKRNEPIYVEYVAKKIAEIKEISVEDVTKITTENAKKLYRIG
ncbi:TatD family hydrolase [Cetobacterium sp. 2G large]|uniref:TatD family hydrolase n=1 Tax=Cetobacterium sp. 2G large TaxID=2759680 RepID=UPI00163BCE1F|nr:TatD family hydrolase [Cetobacterium sp. 2G large]MBC2853889.1 TatD family hydrolase [Cetobacterium sp. 2G large]